MITIKKYEEFKNHLNGFGSGKSISIRMLWNVLQILLFYAVYIYAFEELIFAAGQDSKEMMEKGKTEYQVGYFIIAEGLLIQSVLDNKREEQFTKIWIMLEIGSRTSR